MFKKIFTGILFFTLPIVGLIILGESLFFVYHEEIINSLKMIGVQESFDNGMKIRWGYPIILLLLFGAYKLMGRKVFLFSWIFWIILAVVVYVIFGRSINGLEEIDDSVFQHSSIDFDNIPRLTDEQCHFLDATSEELDKKIGTYFTLADEGAWIDIVQNNPRYTKVLKFLHTKTIQKSELTSPLGKYSEKNIDYLPYAQKVIKEGYILSDITDSNTEASDIITEVIETKNRRDVFYADFKNIHPNGVGIIDIFYTGEEGAKVEELIKQVNEINTQGFGYCIENGDGASLTESLFPKLAYLLKISRILVNYSLLQYISGNINESFQATSILIEFIKQYEEKNTTIVSTMINVAMRGILYQHIENLDDMGYPRYLSKIWIQNISNFDEKNSYINSLRGEYKFQSSFGGLIENGGMRNINIPLLLDGKETDMLSRNILVGAMGDMDDAFKVGKYKKYTSRDELIDNDVMSKKIQLNNIIGNVFIQAMMPTMKVYANRVLQNIIWKNTLIREFQ